MSAEKKTFWNGIRGPLVWVDNRNPSGVAYNTSLLKAVHMCTDTIPLHCWLVRLFAFNKCGNAGWNGIVWREEEEEERIRVVRRMPTIFRDHHSVLAVPWPLLVVGVCIRTWKRNAFILSVRFAGGWSWSCRCWPGRPPSSFAERFLCNIYAAPFTPLPLMWIWAGT